LNIINNEINFVYVDTFGEWIYIPLSDTEININWNHISSETIKLVTEYKHDLFTLNKTITICSNNSSFNINWHIKTNKEIKRVKLEVPILLDLSLDFKDAFIPGFLEWQNPWDNATAVDKGKEWVVVDGTEILKEKIAAILDSTNGILTVFEFNEVPDWSILGALEDRRIDALRVRYELGDLDEWNCVDVNFSIFTKIFDNEEIKPWNRLELEQLLDSSVNSVLKITDFFTYIEEYNIEFVAIDTKKIISNIEATPALDKIYDNGRSVIYTTKK
jgi:hypothetical protein